MAKYFGTDGFRGRVNTVLTAHHAYRIGLALGTLANEDAAAVAGRAARPAVLIGMDTRQSGEMFSAALSAGITATGADVHVAGVVTTPACAYLTRMGDYAFGVMISASHNPYTDNGIKVFNAAGEKMPDETLDRIEEFIDGDVADVKLATGAAVGVVSRKAFLREHYLEYLMDIAVHGAGFYTEDAGKPFAGWHIALDCANGSSAGVGPTLFRALGAKVSVRGNRPDGQNINVKCGSTHIEGLQALVKDKGCDLGFAFDGDADRCLAVDGSGKLVDGDAIMYLCGKYLAGQGRLNGDTVVTTVMSNFGLYKALDEASLRYEKTAVGDRFVYENMVENDFSLGGEQSGHVIFRELATTGDGLVMALMVMEALLASSKTLAQGVEGFTSYPQVLKNVPVTDKAAALAAPEVQAAIARAGEELGETGRVLVRKSGTEQLIRVMAEAADEATAAAMVDAIIAAMCAAGVA
ncbi:MAG: phosphoglucosamine mutase [Eggerthellaceae bacterium]|nr:phosphoglucosamine mutase [Eggerthellaceae bacterium]